jgi:hypothetical protein
VLQKIEHVYRSISLDYQKSNHLTLELKTFFGNSTPMTGLSTESSSQKSRVPIDSHHRHRQKEEMKNLHIKSYKAKLEQLRSARLIHGNQKTNTRHAKALNKTNEPISLLAPRLRTIKHVI